MDGKKRENKEKDMKMFKVSRDPSIMNYEVIK